MAGNKVEHLNKECNSLCNQSPLGSTFFSKVFFLFFPFYRFMLQLAQKTDGVIVTNDNLRDLSDESAVWRDIVKKRYEKEVT